MRFRKFAFVHAAALAFVAIAPLAGIAATPAPAQAAPGDCVGRGVNNYSGKLEGTDLSVHTWDLDQCATETFVEQLKNGATASGACVLAAKAVGLLDPTSAVVAKVVDVVCTASGLATGTSARLIEKAAADGGKCGVTITLKINIARSDYPAGVQYSAQPSDLTLVGQQCPPGVAPKDVDKPDFTSRTLSTGAGSTTIQDRRNFGAGHYTYPNEGETKQQAADRLHQYLLASIDSYEQQTGLTCGPIEEFEQSLGQWISEKLVATCSLI